MPRHIRVTVVLALILTFALGVTAAAGLIGHTSPLAGPVAEAPDRRSGDAGYDPCFSNPYEADVVCLTKW